MWKENKMELYVSEDIKNTTIKCNKKFSCLTNNGSNLCKIISSYNCSVFYILCNNEIACEYKHLLNERTYCNCPTRKEIYNKYKK